MGCGTGLAHKTPSCFMPPATLTHPATCRVNTAARCQCCLKHAVSAQAVLAGPSCKELCQARAIISRPYPTPTPSTNNRQHLSHIPTTTTYLHQWQCMVHHCIQHCIEQVRRVLAVSQQAAEALRSHAGTHRQTRQHTLWCLISCMLVADDCTAPIK